MDIKILSQNIVNNPNDFSAEQIEKYFNDYAKLKVDEVLPQANVSGRSELLFAFIAEVKKEFADQNWDYLDFIAERVLKANNSH